MMETLKFYLIDFWDKESDPRISSYPLMKGGPWINWSIVALYVYFVKSLGPRIMKNRPAYELKPLIIAYNFFMIIINAYFFLEITVTYRFGIDLNIYNFERSKKIEFNPSTMKAVWLSWLYLISKYLDLLETVIFVLRKKYNQISSLHVYHHSIVPVLVHMFIKVSPAGGPGAMFPLLNTLIHTIMYTYYTLAALGLHKYTWWKKYVTQLQLAQFIIFGFYGWYFFLNQKGYPTIFTYLGIIQPIIFFSMFYSFYRRAYNERKLRKEISDKLINNCCHVEKIPSHSTNGNYISSAVQHQDGGAESNNNNNNNKEKLANGHNNATIITTTTTNGHLKSNGTPLLMMNGRNRGEKEEIKCEEHQSSRTSFMNGHCKKE